MVQGQVITESRPCPACEYDLRGLRVGGVCPECGEPIRAARKSFGPREGHMTDAPPSYVRGVVAAFALMTVGIMAFMFGVVALLIGPAVGAVLAMAGSAAWAGGLFLLTRPRPPRFAERADPVLDAPRFRTIVRAAGAAWIVFVLLAFFTPLAGPIAPAVRVLAGLSGLAAFVGLIPTSVYVADLEFWMSDDTGGWQLRGAAWAMMVFGVIGLVLAFIVPFFSVVAFVVVAVAAGVLCWHVIGCVTQARWVLRYQKENAGRADRITARLRDQSERPGTVSGSMTCHGCGYELRGLPYGGVCPECGESYADRTPMPIRPVPARDDTPIEVDASESVRQAIRARDPAFARRPEPADESPIPLSGDEDLPEDFQDPPPSEPAPADHPDDRPDDRPPTDEQGPIPFADDDEPPRSPEPGRP